MISDKIHAKTISEALLEASGILNESVEVALKGENPEEGKKYAEIIAEVMGIFCLDILNPIFRMHPDIKPREYFLPESDVEEKD